MIQVSLCAKRDWGDMQKDVTCGNLGTLIVEPLEGCPLVDSSLWKAWPVRMGAGHLWEVVSSRVEQEVPPFVFLYKITCKPTG